MGIIEGVAPFALEDETDEEGAQETEINKS